MLGWGDERSTAMSSKFSLAVAVSPQGRKLTTTLAVVVNDLSNLESSFRPQGRLQSVMSIMG
jgi:hypothetical protein